MTRFLTRLAAYQDDAVAKIGKLKVGALYMEQGTGKTRTAMELAFRRIDAGKADHVIWLCPCNVRADIRAEFIKHMEHIPPQVTICGIETLSSSIRWNIALLNLAQSRRCFLIVDESNLVKNGRAQRTRNIMRIAEACPYRLILNGTPIAKNEADLFAQWQILDWRILGYKSFWAFAHNHIKWSDIRGKIDAIINVDYLMRKIAPYTYQITKDEAFPLPQKHYHVRYVYMTEAQMDHYHAVADALMPQVDQAEQYTVYRLFSALDAVISGLWVTDTNKSHFTTSPMFDDPWDNPRIRKLLDCLTDEKTIIFCKRSHEVDSIMQVLNDRRPDCAVEFTGRISSKQRQKNKELFRGPARYMVANKACGAYGLNLQFCHRVIYYSNDWDYATRAQSEDRVHRRGQTQDVFIIDLVADKSLDQRIYKCLSRKENLLDGFKEAVKYRQKLEGWINGEEISDDRRASGGAGEMPVSV